MDVDSVVGRGPIGVVKRSMQRFAARTALLVLVSCLVAAAANAVRPRPLPWVAASPYPILHDCPEVTATAGRIAADALSRAAGPIVYVDARPRAEYLQGHVDGAIDIPYDPLTPVAATDLRAIRARRPRLVVVYGAGGTGQLLADDLASARLPGVRYVEEDLMGLRRAGVPVRPAPGGSR